MLRKTFAGVALAVAITGVTHEPTNARRPIHWKVGEYQRTPFPAEPGDTISVFFATRDTEANVQKCDNMGGAGLILVRWRSKLWEVCTSVDF